MELLVVLVIIGLSAGLVVPKLFSSLTKANLKNSALHLRGVVRYARSQSVTTSRLYSLDIDLDNERYTLRAKEAVALPKPPPDLGDFSLEEYFSTPTPAPQPVAPAKELVKRVILPDGLEIAGYSLAEDYIQRDGIVNIVFYPRGNCTGGTIYLRDENGREIWVEVNAVLSRAQTVFPEADERKFY